MVISLPSAANTRPPLLRHAFRSYWQGPISGCLRQRPATFGENSMTVCCRWPAASVTHTYCALAGSTIAGAEARTPGGASGAGGIGVSGRGRRITGAFARSPGGVTGKGALAVSCAQPPMRSRKTPPRKAALAVNVCGGEWRDGSGDGRYGGGRALDLIAM